MIERLVALLILPLLFGAILWYLLLKKFYDDPNPSEYLPTREQAYILLYLAITEYLGTQQIPEACILRIQDKETRITHFMYSAQGSKSAYALAGIIFDLIERFTVSLIVSSVYHAMVMGSPLISPAGLGIICLYSIYDITKTLIIFHSVSYLFDKRDTLIKFSGLLSSLLYSLSIGISSSTFVFFKNMNMEALSRISFIRSGFNLVVLLFPVGNHKYDEIKDESIKIYGGFWPNFITMIIHLLLALGLVLFIDSRSDRIKMKVQKKDPRVVEGADMRNIEELKAEENNWNTHLPAISVQQIEMVYPNKFLAAQNVSFGVEPGTLFTLLGPNGAGKTSVLEVLAGIEMRTEGVVVFEKEHIDKYKNKKLSFCLQKNYLWEHITFRQHLEIVGHWRGIERSELQKFISDIDIALQLGKNLDIEAHLLSGGNKRKLNTVLALMAAPHIYILDEPTAGMDPASRRYMHFKKIFLEYP